jgi:hypothetical protein
MPLKHTKRSLKKRHGIRHEMSGSDSWDRFSPNNIPFLLLVFIISIGFVTGCGGSKQKYVTPELPKSQIATIKNLSTNECRRILYSRKFKMKNTYGTTPFNHMFIFENI